MNWQPMASAPLSGEFLAAIEVRHGGGKGPILWHQHVLMRDNETGEIHRDYSQGWDLEDYAGWQSLPPSPGISASDSMLSAAPVPAADQQPTFRSRLADRCDRLAEWEPCDCGCETNRPKSAKDVALIQAAAALRRSPAASPAVRVQAPAPSEHTCERGANFGEGCARCDNESADGGAPDDK